MKTRCFITSLLMVASAAVFADGPAVLVKTINEQQLAEPYESTGRVEATDKVDIFARVNGMLQQRLFTEGTAVQAGDPLFQIEKQPYQIHIRQQQASLAGARASLKQAEAELSRNRQLRKRGAVSKAELEVIEAKRDQNKAQLMQAEAGVEQAELDLSYTDITSPITGSIGKSLVSPGNLITANDTLLATIVSTDPVYVEIAISDKLLLDLRKEGPIDTSKAVPRLLLADGSYYPHNGSFDFIDPQINRDTDTIAIRTRFPNSEGVLVPGQFVRMQITPREILPVLAVPQAAVQRDRQGTFVMLVDQQNRIKQQRVTTGDQVSGQWIIESGISQGDRVVVEGLQKIQPGILVQATELQ